MQHTLYVVDDWSVRAECENYNDAFQQATECFNNCWWTVYIDEYTRNDDEITRKCEYWEILFYHPKKADWNIFRDEYDDYWIEFRNVYTMQDLHTRQIVTEKAWELSYTNIDSEDYEITDDLYHAVQKAVEYWSLILSITRNN